MTNQLEGWRWSSSSWTQTCMNLFEVCELRWQHHFFLVSLVRMSCMLTLSLPLTYIPILNPTTQPHRTSTLPKPAAYQVIHVAAHEELGPHAQERHFP